MVIVGVVMAVLLCASDNGSTCVSVNGNGEGSSSGSSKVLLVLN